MFTFFNNYEKLDIIKFFFEICKDKNHILHSTKLRIPVLEIYRLINSTSFDYLFKCQRSVLLSPTFFWQFWRVSKTCDIHENKWFFFIFYTWNFRHFILCEQCKSRYVKSSNYLTWLWWKVIKLIIIMVIWKLFA